ncbi:MAG: FHA domain-containing protein, partial [Proteobacteria bacterium]|nr:FHA domain-containing protein [Pseudomonadota bacterium]
MKQIFDWEHEPIDVAKSVTIGRHLDNDLIASGEDVLDYHLRLEPHERGLNAHPLNGATLSVNGREFAETVGLMIGDKVAIGSNTGTVSVAYDAPAQADRWVLVSGDNTRTYPIDHEL